MIIMDELKEQATRFTNRELLSALLGLTIEAYLLKIQRKEAEYSEFIKGVGIYEDEVVRRMEDSP